MLATKHFLMVIMGLVLLLAGCSGRPVRNLASDAALIKVGQSTRQDVLTYLGEPDEQESSASGMEKWVFREIDKSRLKNAPLVGRYFGEKNEGTVTVVLKGDQVVACEYGAIDPAKMKWADDFDWQEN